LTTLYLASAKNTNSWCARKGDLQRAFPLDVPMVPSSALSIAADGERLLSDGFSLGETIHIGNLKFITNRFGYLSPPLGPALVPSSWVLPTVGHRSSSGP
jgi:hypothetical protein